MTCSAPPAVGESVLAGCSGSSPVPNSTGRPTVPPSSPDAARPRLLFVTGRLAEPALRRVLAELGPRAGFEPVVAVLPISVAALLTTDWVARHLEPPDGVERVILPGFCGGDAAAVADRAGAPAERGPKDLRDLPEFFGHQSDPPPGYGGH